MDDTISERIQRPQLAEWIIHVLERADEPLPAAKINRRLEDFPVNRSGEKYRVAQYCSMLKQVEVKEKKNKRRLWGLK